MAWYNESGKNESTVISTRVRFARNLADYPFTGRLSSAGATEVIEKIKEALPEYSAINFSSLSAAEAQAYVERHYVSPMFTDKRLPRVLLTGAGENVQIMLCEEDHIRIQSIVAGFDPQRAFDAACGADDKLCSKLKIAFDTDLGYLTHCPTNLGNAMRVSAMMFLPALSMLGRIEGLSPGLNKLGMTIRGMYGEGSRAEGNIYQISNSGSLGVSEADVIKNFTDVINRVSELEEKARKSILEGDTDKLTDRVYRSLGILKSAYLLDSDELSKRLSDVRLGSALGIIETVPMCKLTELSVSAQPATMILSGEGLDNEVARDKARARLVKAVLEASK
ncbi:MAG: ATP--guanido phosphotransferase [Clostridia bacterium]|nr:ATP--guanido phosphotransferase [Clostridia bacterium]